MNYAEVDKTSYQLYLDQNWDGLIDYTSKARKNGIEYFYLQVRTGISYYNLGKYRNASTWFLKAWETDKSFDWLQEYLYYSLVFAGRINEASKISDGFSHLLKKKLNLSYQGLKRIAYEGGSSFKPDFENLQTRQFNTEIDLGDDYGEGYILKNYSFHTIDVNYHLGSNFSLNQSLTYLGLNREANITWGEQTTSPIKINQFQYFANPLFVVGKKWYVSPSVNLIFGNNDLYYGSLDKNSERIYSTSKIKFSDYVFSTSTWSHFGNFSSGVELNYGNINDTKFSQLSAWITIYPLSTTELYFTPRVYFKSDSEQNSFGWNAISLSGGVQLGPVHLFGQYIFGDMKNFVESTGYIVSNFPGSSDRKISGSIYFPLGKKTKIVIRYINQNILEDYQAYTDGYLSKSLEYNYIKHTFTGGISWNL
jgi:hypothetical protein